MKGDVLQPETAFDQHASCWPLSYRQLIATMLFETWGLLVVRVRRYIKKVYIFDILHLESYHFHADFGH